ERTQYLSALTAQQQITYLRRCVLRHPLRVARVLPFVIRHRYAAEKHRTEDLRTFRQAVSLAGMLLDNGVTHLHCPWADRSAFVGLLAAHLAAVPYSVQARASADLYRGQSRWALAEKFMAARFIVTGSEFNRRFIEAS